MINRKFFNEIIFIVDDNRKPIVCNGNFDEATDFEA